MGATREKKSNFHSGLILLFELLSIPVGRTKVVRSGLSVQKPTSNVLLFKGLNKKKAYSILLFMFVNRRTFFLENNTSEKAP